MGAAEGSKKRTTVVVVVDAWRTAGGAAGGAVTGSGNEVALVGAAVGEVKRLSGIAGIIPTTGFRIAIYEA
jgi:hypothetical protein